MKLGFLYGIRAGDWWRLLQENGFALTPTGWPHALLLTLLSVQNSFMARRDGRVDLSGVKVRPPIFILGHWRSGTTHLHYLLERDRRFATPSMYACAYPWGFLRHEKSHRRLIQPLAPRSRPQDRVPISLQAPQEDELAVACMSLRTPYLGWVFPRHASRYLSYLTFRGAPAEHQKAFENALLHFVRKLSHRFPGKTLVLKSPGHTARISMLLRLFPSARFVHIVRNPYDVYQSSLHLYRSWQRSFAFLQQPNTDGVERWVLSVYGEMLRAYIDEEHLLPIGRSHEIRFETLERDPLGELRRLYQCTGLDGFPEEELRRYIDSTAGYRKNNYQPLDPASKARVAEEWAFAFERWGYAV